MEDNELEELSKQAEKILADKITPKEEKNRLIEKSEKLIKLSAAGLIPVPKKTFLWWNKLCPYCETKLTKTCLCGCYVYHHYSCTRCDYEYAKRRRYLTT